MKIKNIAFKNITRKKGKTLFLLSSMIIAIATVVTIVTFTQVMTGDMNHNLEQYGANIIITPPKDTLTLNYGGVSLGGISINVKEIKEDELEKIKEIKYSANIAGVWPQVFGVVKIKEQQLLLSGINFDLIDLFRPWWKLQKNIKNENSLIAGAEAARILKIKIGEKIKIKKEIFTVTNILEMTASQDDQILFTSLKAAQRVHDKINSISIAEVAARCKNCPVEEMVSQISKVLPNARVMAIKQVVKSRMDTLAQLKTFSYILSLVILFIGGLIVTVTMTARVKERTNEIGIFRAIGFRKSHVMKILYVETSIISLIAGIIGYFTGVTITILIKKYFLVSQNSFQVFDISIILITIFASILVGILSTIYPAYQAAKLEPAIALRSL